MRRFLFLLLVLVISFNPLSALESQIILINSEAYLVDLDDNFDVVHIHERIPEYFQDHSSHEEILASYIGDAGLRDIGHEQYLIEFIEVEKPQFSVGFDCNNCRVNNCSMSNLYQNHNSFFLCQRVYPKYKKRSEVYSLASSSSIA